MPKKTVRHKPGRDALLDVNFREIGEPSLSDQLLEKQAQLRLFLLELGRDLECKPEISAIHAAIFHRKNLIAELRREIDNLRQANTDLALTMQTEHEASAKNLQYAKAFESTMQIAKSVLLWNKERS